MTTEEKIQFVNENINLVPNTMKSRFEKFDPDKQYDRMLHYVEMEKLREEAMSMTKLAWKVKQLFETKKATIEDATAVIEFCNKFIDSCKEQELARVNEEIQRLTELKSKLEAK